MDNRNTYDFKVSTIKGTAHLTFIYGQRWPRDGPYPKGAGIIADASFNIRGSVNVTDDIEEFNLHELTFVEDGKSVLTITYKNEWRDISDLGLENRTGWVGDSRIQEIDMATGDIKFEWSAFNHIPLTESFDLLHVEGGFAPEHFIWDYV